MDDVLEEMIREASSTCFGLSILKFFQGYATKNMKCNMQQLMAKARDTFLCWDHLKTACCFTHMHEIIYPALKSILIWFHDDALPWVLLCNGFSFGLIASICHNKLSIGALQMIHVSKQKFLINYLYSKLFLP